MNTFSISNSVNKENLTENLSMYRATLDDAQRRAHCGADQADQADLTNEQIEKGNILLETYEVTGDAIFGGMGNVWRVHHRKWNTDLAMKRPKPRFYSEAGSVQKELFVRECENWIQLGLHPNIVSCFYVREIGGVPTVFSEWMNGGSLRDRIRDGSLYGDEEEAVHERILDIAVQTARGLAFAHEKGLIHQDIKPGNLLLSETWEAKVSDFGLTQAIDALHNTPNGVPWSGGKSGVSQKETAGSKSKAAGRRSAGYTLAYCPREQTEGAVAEPWMDVYAWALTILELYIGRRLWETGAEAAGKIQEYLSETGDYVSGIHAIPAAMGDLLRSCLQDRTSGFQAIGEKLETIYRDVTGVRYPRSLVKAWDDTPDSLNNYALSFLDLGKTEEARACLEAAVKMDPNCMNAVYNDAVLAWRQGRTNGFEAERRIRDIQYENRQDPAITKREKELRLPRRTAVLERRVRTENKTPRGLEKGIIRHPFLSAAAEDGRYLLVSYMDSESDAAKVMVLDEPVTDILHVNPVAEWNLPGFRVENLAVSPDGTCAAVSFSDMRDNSNPTIAVWKLHGRPENMEAGREETAGEVFRISAPDTAEIYFDRSGTVLAARKNNGQVEAWRIPDAISDTVPDTVLQAAYCRIDSPVLSMCPGYETGTFWLATEKEIALYVFAEDRMGEKSEMSAPAFHAVMGTMPASLPYGFVPDHLTLSKNGEVLAASMRDASRVKKRRIVWHTGSGEILLDYESMAITAGKAVLSPDGRWLVMTEEYSMAERVLQTVDLSVSPQVYSVPLPESTICQALSFTPDGDRLILLTERRIYSLDQNWNGQIERPVRAEYEISRIQSVKQRETLQEEYERTLSEARNAFAGRERKEGFEKLYHAWHLPGYENSEECRRLNQEMACYGSLTGIRSISRQELPVQRGEKVHAIFENGNRGLCQTGDGSWLMREFSNREERTASAQKDTAFTEPFQNGAHKDIVFPKECQNASLLATDEGRHAAWFAVSKKGFLGRERVQVMLINTDSGEKIEESGRLLKTIPKDRSILYSPRSGEILAACEGGIRIISVDAFKIKGSIPIEDPAWTIMKISRSGEWLILYDMDKRILTTWNLFDMEKTAEIQDPLLCATEHTLGHNGTFLLAKPVYPEDEVRLYWTRVLEEEWRVRKCPLLMGEFLPGDRKILALTADRAKMLDTETGNTISEVGIHNLAIYDNTTLSEDGNILFTPGRNEMWIIDYLYTAWQ